MQGVTKDSIIHLIKSSSTSSFTSSTSSSFKPITTPQPVQPATPTQPSEASIMAMLNNPFALMQDDDFIDFTRSDGFQQFMSSPYMQSFFSNPEAIQQILTMNPAMKDIMEKNPEMSAMLRNPQVLKQMGDMARSPTIMKEYLRQADNMQRQLETLPGGFQYLQQMTHDVQDPVYESLGKQAKKMTKMLTGNTQEESETDSSAYLDDDSSEDGNNAEDGENDKIESLYAQDGMGSAKYAEKEAEKKGRKEDEEEDDEDDIPLANPWARAQTNSFGLPFPGSQTSNTSRFKKSRKHKKGKGKNGEKEGKDKNNTSDEAHPAAPEMSPFQFLFGPASGNSAFSSQNSSQTQNSTPTLSRWERNSSAPVEESSNNSANSNNNNSSSSSSNVVSPMMFPAQMTAEQQTEMKIKYSPLVYFIARMKNLINSNTNNSNSSSNSSSSSSPPPYTPPTLEEIKQIYTAPNNHAAFEGMAGNSEQQRAFLSSDASIQAYIDANPALKEQIEVLLANPTLFSRHMKAYDRLLGLTNSAGGAFGSASDLLLPAAPSEEDVVRYAQRFNGYSTSELRHYFSAQLKQLHELGFVDDAVNIKALKMSGGSLERAIELIMSFTGRM